MIRHWVGYLCLALLIFVQIHNHFSFPWTRGFDAAGHVEYINYLKTNHHLPKPWEGWELYQPPLYYALGSFLPSLQIVQWLNLLVWIGIIGISYVVGKKIIPKFWYIAPLCTASFPISLYLSHTISNEPLSALLISLAIWLYSNRSISSPTTHFVLIALVAGLALLTKPTAWVLIAAISLDAILTKTNRQFAIGIICLTLLMSCWFYVRSYQLAGNPFVTSTDYPQFTFKQLPGYRDALFFLNLSPFVTGDIFQAHWYSFFPGTYFGWFWDSQNVIIPIQPNSKAGIGLLLLSIPITIIMIRGFCETWRQKTYRITILYAILLFCAYIAYNLKYPYYSSVKAVYLYSLIIPSIMWFCLGLSKLSEKATKIVPWYSFTYVLAVCYAFYIRPWWY